MNALCFKAGCLSGAGVGPMSDFAHDLQVASRKTRRAFLFPEALAPRVEKPTRRFLTVGHTRGGVPPRRACTEPAPSLEIPVCEFRCSRTARAASSVGEKKNNRTTEPP